MSVTVNGNTYLASADGKIYGQYPAGDAPVNDLPTYADRTKLVTASASGGGDGSEGNPWTLTEAMTSAVAGDIVGIEAGVYVGTGTENREQPAFQPSNSGTLANPIVFVAENQASKSVSGFTDIRSGAPTHGTGWPAFGVNGQDYIQWIGIKSDTTQINNRTDNDAAPCTIWNSTGSKVQGCELIGEASVINDNYSGIRFEIAPNFEASDNKIHGFEGFTNNAGILFYGSPNSSLHHNEIYDCHSGIHSKGAAGGSDMYGISIYLNLIRDCFVTFRPHGPVKGPGGELSLIYQNICYGQTYTFEYSSSAQVGVQNGLRVFNNVFYGSGTGDYWIHHEYSTDGVIPRDNKFFNNIHKSPAAYLYGEVAYDSTVAHYTDFGDYDRNCISSPTNFGNGASSSQLDSLTFSSWQTTYSEDVNSITSDPLFTNEVAQDFTLQGGSPCIGLGRDNLGQFGPVDAAIDAGVYVTGSEIVGVR